MDLNMFILYFLVFFSATLIGVVCHLGSLLVRIQKLMVADSSDPDDLDIRLKFIQKVNTTFAVSFGILFTEIIFLAVLIVLNF